MKDLEKYFFENRDQFDSVEPNEDHQKRFKEKLRARDRKPGGINFRHALQIAASIAIILASGIVIVKSSKGSGKMAQSPEVQEFQEAQNYYAQQVSTRYESISDLSFENEAEKKILLDELASMDSYYRELLEEYNANPGDKRVMNVLIQHYQMKISVMDQIINQLEQIKESNTKENEQANI